MKKNSCLVTVILLHLRLFSQCINQEKITSGGDFGAENYIHLCPTYQFDFGGDTSKNWNVLNDPIDITQAPANILTLKNYVEERVKEFAGINFFLKLKFDGISVVYPDKLQAFIDSGRQDVTLEFYKAKYFFYYNFMPDTLMRYHIGIAVDSLGKIISSFNFPSKQKYKAIDTTYTYCKLIEIAKNVLKQIEPIKEIRLEFDDKVQRFYWLIVQEIVHEKQGLNHLNEVMIDAANLTNTKLKRSKVYIEY